MPRVRAGALLACAALAAAAVAGTAAPAPSTAAAPLGVVAPIEYGVADDSSKFAEDGGEWFFAQLRGAGLAQNRWTLSWDPAAPTEIRELPFLERAAPKAQEAGVRIVLVLQSIRGSAHPAAQFCGWAASVAATVAQWGIVDFIVWNEPNTRLFWTPQKNRAGQDVAALAYEALLARCYDAIKQANPAARVIGMGLSPRASTAESTEPLAFLRDVGRAYRASGRTLPIMDQLAIHPYPNPNSPSDSPDIGYPQLDRFGISNLDRVKRAVWDAFHGTAQPTTLNGLTLRIDEIGWQVRTSLLSQYMGRENVKTVSESQQAQYLRRMVTKYFACDPAVTDVLLFLLVDERYRDGRDEQGQFVGGGWQSGLLTYGGPGVSTPRAAYNVMAQLAAEGRGACESNWVSWAPGGDGWGGPAAAHALVGKSKPKRP
jgi:hypothetical protein